MLGFPLLRRLLFACDPEVAHGIGLTLLRFGLKVPFASLLLERTDKPVELLGMTLRNPVGLAAGFDKNAEYLHEMSSIGFGYVEVGTMTPRPQRGSVRPRLFRLSDQEAIINRMGFNNKGVEVVVRNIQRACFRGVLGVNIGANRDTPEHQRTQDYLHCLERVYGVASYVAINISSPNTPALRNLQGKSELDMLVGDLCRSVRRLRDRHRKEVPLLVKIAPDLDETQLDDIGEVLTRHGVGGVIATNTTISRAGVEKSPLKDEAGGMSGAPLKPLSLHVVSYLRKKLPMAMPIIGCGGIMSAGDGVAFQNAGAACVQMYSGLVFKGPALIHEVARSWK